MKAQKMIEGRDPGTQPVSVLRQAWEAAIAANGDVFDSEYKRLIDSGKFTGNIEYIRSELAILLNETRSQTPRAVKKDGIGHILLYETHLSFLWCIAYAMVSIYKNSLVLKKRDGKDISDAINVLNYGKNLMIFFSKWKIDSLPNPEFVDAVEDTFISQVNSVFCHAVNFIFCHEFSHILRGHLEQDDETRSRLSIQNETEADAGAINIVKNRPDFECIFVRVGALTAIGSMLLVVRKLEDGTHPSPDKRLNHLLVEIAKDEDDPIWFYAALFLAIWFDSVGMFLEFNRPELSAEKYYGEFYKEIRASLCTHSHENS